MKCTGCGTEESDRWYVGSQRWSDGIEWGTCSPCALKMEVDKRTQVLANRVSELEGELEDARVKLDAAMQDLVALQTINDL